MKNEPAVPSYDSMTLRDYFAAKALEGYLAAHAGPDVQMPGVNHTAALADFDYDNGFGSEVVYTSLVIKFKDGTWLSRGEYDGSEWWDYNQFPLAIGDAPLTKIRYDEWE